MVFTEIERKTFRSLPFGLHTLCDSAEQAPIIRPKGMGYHHLLWVTGGSGVYRVGSDSFFVGEGDGVFMRANTPHSYEGEGFYTGWCTFLMPIESLDVMGIGSYMRFKLPSDFQRETEELLRFANGNSTVLSRSAAGYSYIMRLFSSILLAEQSVASRVRGLLERSYSLPLTLSDISEEIGVDKYTLCHVYKREMGVTIIDDLNRIRIQKAKQMLKYSGDSIELIARLCGFESHSYFTLRFRQALGCTPTEYRRGVI